MPCPVDPPAGQVRRSPPRRNRDHRPLPSGVARAPRRRPMKAVTFQGTGHVRVDTVPDPTISQPTDAVVRITSTAICGSDLHLYDVMGPLMSPGDVHGHESIGIVEEVGPEVT